ncbi:MAG: hypothetical protein IJ291_00945 [Lachnospiraceae bacterium]|nr:hypothetical protein [Lachnospiraceae bacterium]
MEKKNKILCNVSYGLMALPNLMTVLLLISAIIGAIWVFIEALKDVNGGGWLIFIILGAGLLLSPVLVGWIIQLVLYVVGLFFLIRKSYGTAMVLGCISMAFAAITTLVLALVGIYIIYGAEWEFIFWVIAALFVIASLFCAGLAVLSCVAAVIVFKEKKKMNNMEA